MKVDIRTKDLKECKILVIMFNKSYMNIVVKTLSFKSLNAIRSITESSK